MVTNEVKKCLQSNQREVDQIFWYHAALRIFDAAAATLEQTGEITEETVKDFFSQPPRQIINSFKSLPLAERAKIFPLFNDSHVTQHFVNMLIDALDYYRRAEAELLRDMPDYLVVSYDHAKNGIPESELPALIKVFRELKNPVRSHDNDVDDSELPARADLIKF